MNIKENNSIKNFQSISTICRKCQGKHFQPNDLTASQQGALQEFGLIPSDCVASLDVGKVTHHCPYAK